MSEFIGDDPCHSYAKIGSSSKAYLTLAHIFVENLIVDDVTKLQFPVSRPVGEALLGTPDNLGGTED